MSIQSLWPHPHPGFAHLLPSREKATPLTSQSGLLPLWEKVAKGRMRGEPQIPAFQWAANLIASFAARASAWGLDPRAARGEGSARVGRSAHQGPLTLTLSPAGAASRMARMEQLDFVAIHIPVRGSFIHVAPR